MFKEFVVLIIELIADALSSVRSTNVEQGLHDGHMSWSMSVRADFSVISRYHLM